MAERKKREQTPERKEQTRRAVAKHAEKVKEEQTNATSEAIANKDEIDISDFNVLAEAMDALATVKAAITVSPPGSVASLATTQLKLAVEIDRYKREIEENKTSSTKKTDSKKEDGFSFDD